MSATLSPLEIPAEILSSPLFARRGFSVIPAVFADHELDELTAEASDARATAVRNVLERDRGSTLERGGAPARAFATAHGGAVQWRLFTAPALLDSIRKMSGLTAQPTGSGSFTYYEHAGDFLALHRDIVTCDLAVITCLSETASDARSGGGLLLYPQFVREPLSAVSAAGTCAGIPAYLGCGDTIFLLGGIVPHEVLPMQPDRERIVSVMCYRISPPT